MLELIGVIHEDCEYNDALTGGGISFDAKKRIVGPLAFYVEADASKVSSTVPSPVTSGFDLKRKGILLNGSCVLILGFGETPHGEKRVNIKLGAAIQNTSISTKLVKIDPKDDIASEVKTEQLDHQKVSGSLGVGITF